MKTVQLDEGDPNTCTYACQSYYGDFWYLIEDNSEPGYWCPTELGPCDPDTEDTTTIDAPEDESSLSSKGLSAGVSLAKNSAVYAYDPAKKLLIRMRGKWAKGMTSPSEYTIHALAKVDKSLGALAASLAKNKSIGSFQLIVPAQKLPSPKSVLAKTKPATSLKKAIVKKSNTKKTNKRSS